MQTLVQRVYQKLKENGIIINDVRINGGLATWIIGDCVANKLGYNDIDVIFSVDLDSEEQLLRLKDYVMDCLLEYFDEGTNRGKLSHGMLTDAYVSKLTKVWQKHGDKWTLVTLSNDFGMNLELKFVDTMKRKYQFSVDSFQIILDSLMQFYDLSSAKMSEDFYPTVVVESMYGEYGEAVHHLNNRLIATRSPQEIRGGGLLKYCDLLARGYKAVSDLSETETLERLMCSRFFIDYSDISTQYQKLDSYLCNHFSKNYALMLRYLRQLHAVVNNSTVCLMGHERRQALDLITQLAYSVQYNIDMQYPSHSDLVHHPHDMAGWHSKPVYSSNDYHNYYSVPVPSFYGYPCHIQYAH